MRTLTSAALTTLLLLAGCGGSAPTHESLAKEGTQLMKDFVGTLETITDKNSAQAARPKLEAIAKSLGDLRRKADALGKPAPEVEQKIAEQMKVQQTELAGRMDGWVKKMNQTHPEATAAIQDVLDQLSKSASGR